MKRFNWRLWTGLLLVVVAFISYYAVFSQFVITRDVPWVPFLLFAAAAFLLVSGWRHAPRKVLASIVGLLGFLIIGLFTFLVTIFSSSLPVSLRAPAIGQQAPGFALPDTNGRTVVLADLLRGSNGVLLVFYRGHW